MSTIESAADKYTALVLGMKRQLAGNAGAKHVISVISSAAEESKGLSVGFIPTVSLHVLKTRPLLKMPNKDASLHPCHHL